ncbi:MAG: pitrilysin family protein [Myxococcota bacterium]
MRRISVSFLMMCTAAVSACSGKSRSVEAAPRAATQTENSASANRAPEVSLDVEGTAAAMPDVDIPYESFTLDNGLRVIVHTDRKAPVVAVSVWYHVGSKNEVKGKTGFAHLFEHLMFNGSENFDGEFFDPLQKVGATDLNGTTWFDRTNYFQTVPTPALELALWLESDRMGHLLGAVTQEKLDNQRGVVQNEKRQGDNQPFGTTEYRVLEGLLPEGHPYRWSTIGSMEDLEAASLEDVKAWFKRYYGPNNAVLVLAGDIDRPTAQTLVNKYFGDIAPGPPLYALERWVPTRVENVRESMSDRVANVRIERHWVVPPRTDRETNLLNVVAEILGGGKTSRLYQRLVYDEQVASSVSATVEPHELASFFQIQIDVKQGVDPAAVEMMLDATLAELLTEGPSADEVIGARAQINSSVVKNLERVGGFGGKATRLATGALYANDPGHWKTALGWINEARPNNLKRVAQSWLASGYYQLTVEPFGEPKAGPASAKEVRTKMPEVSGTPDLKFPEIQRGKLDNGIEVVLATRSVVPEVSVVLQFDAGFAADAGDKLGLASFTLDMLDEGTESRDALGIARELEVLGASLFSGSTLDTSQVGVSALNTTLGDAVAILADVVQNPAFAERELVRIRKQRLESIAKEMVEPVALALRFLPPLIYGEGHPYAIPFRGTGTAESVRSIERDDLARFRERWLRPDNATLFVAGDTTLDSVIPILNRTLGTWKTPSVAKGAKTIQAVKRSGGRVVIIDRPGSPQTMLLAGHLAPPAGADNALAIEAMNAAIGGQFTARINMNLREEKGWAYGAFTFLPDARGQRPFMVYAPVQSDKTAASIAETLRELRAFIGQKPITQLEFDRIVKNFVRRLPGQFETTSAVLSAMLENQRFGRKQDYVSTLASQYRALGLADAKRAAQEVIDPKDLIWLVVGDRKTIEPEIRKLGLGEIQVQGLGLSSGQ